MNNTTYTQFDKQAVRHSALSYAISLLTENRNNATCVSRNYVRKVYDSFVMNEDEDSNKAEAKKVEKQYILDWERLFDSCLGSKRPSDLVICYLCGPEPKNDFDEMVSLGVLPQNIWAFEEDRGTYRTALSSYETGCYSQPRIIRQNIETFFQQTPKKFDIVYIDACGTVPSEQHALRCVSTLFNTHRLSSPGIIISNFSEPDDKDPYIDLIAQYVFSKTDKKYTLNKKTGQFDNPEYLGLVDEVKKDFYRFYGEYITFLLRDIPSVIVPISRFWKNPFLNQMIDNTKPFPSIDNVDLEAISNMGSIQRFILSYNYQKKHGICDGKTDMLISEIDPNQNIVRSLFESQLLKDGKMPINLQIEEVQKFFESKSKIYQFLDRPHRNMFYDLVINQMSYPFHCCTEKVRRFRYCAKKTTMFTDIIPFDECRYIYEWVPGLHQIISAFQNLSWQYSFRFALDGLIKSRQLYNNEFFYQGSVVSHQNSEFSLCTMPQREIISGGTFNG